jgi:transcriptional regulator with XRE-family HTH domain
VLLGAVLRSERTEQGKTLRVVADAARISMAYLSEVERGRKEASSEILAAICQALGLRLVDLLGRVQWLLLADGIDDLERDPLGADRTVVRLSPLDGTGDPGRSAPTVSGTAFALALAG